MYKITIVIPNYNGIRFMEQCLSALLCQAPDTPRYKILVVDNGSKDGSGELVKERFPQVTVISLSENTGFCHAVNVGIQAADSPYVVLLNNDTRVGTGFLKALYRAIEGRDDAFSVSARMLMWDNESLLDGAGDRYCVLGWAYARGKGRLAANYDRGCRIFSACGGAAIYRREVFEKVGYFDEAHFAYLEDLDIGYRAMIYGYRNYYEPDAQVVHYGSAASGSRYNEWKTGLAAANNVYCAVKNMPFIQLLWNMPFLLLGFLVKFFFFVGKGLGVCYFKGLIKGVKRSLSREGRSKKVRFRLENLGNYFFIQGQLYMNVFRFLKKS